MGYCMTLLNGVTQYGIFLLLFENEKKRRMNLVVAKIFSFIFITEDLF